MKNSSTKNTTKQGSKPSRMTGIAIPLGAIYTKKNTVIGEFTVLPDFAKFCKKAGIEIIQLLPVNDTGTQSSPYSGLSAFALHPIYIDIAKLPEFEDVSKDKDFEKKYKDFIKKFPYDGKTRYDYDGILNAKDELLRTIYATTTIAKSAMPSEELTKWIKKNPWIVNYAVYKNLKHKYMQATWKSWKKQDQEVSEKEIKNRWNKDADKKEHLFYAWTQMRAAEQFKKACDAVKKEGIIIKGDMPILMNEDSCDAWALPGIFNQNLRAGSPVDGENPTGQNWGFPTYNWEEMNKDGFAWWKNRFRKMAEYFDAYRIDHILGFFRIWQIPMDAVHGLLGTFNPAMPFSADEMRNSYDFWINPEVQTKPYIMDYFLGDFFGEYTEEAKNKFLEQMNDGRYRLKEFVDTQRKVEAYFAAQLENEKNERLRDGLYGLIDDVLFIEDAELKGHYHPRISAQFTYSYRSLTDYERWCFDRLYNDFFYHRHNDFWYGKAMWKLPPLINATDMLVCGEDLGMIPDCVASVMSGQKILSLEIQRMPKDPKQEFGNPYIYPYMCVCTTSTHDMSGIRAWWEEDREKTQHFYNNVLQQWGEAPQFAEPWICDKIVCDHLNSPAILTILPLQDWLSVSGDLRRENPQEEQINVPANPFHYWRYRMHLTLEELLDQKVFNESIKDRIKNSGR